MKQAKHVPTKHIQQRLGFTADGAIGLLRRHRIPSIRLGRRLFWNASAVERLLGRLEMGKGTP